VDGFGHAAAYILHCSTTELQTMKHQSYTNIRTKSEIGQYMKIYEYAAQAQSTLHFAFLAGASKRPQIRDTGTLTALAGFSYGQPLT
jgi:hypothetical protein